MTSAVVAPMQTQESSKVAARKLAEGNIDSGDSVESSNAEKEEGATPLMYASQQGKDTVVQQMLAAEPGCVQARDRTGKTALHYCCEQAGPSTAALLLAAAPTLLDSRDHDGYAPLTLSVIAGNRTLVRYLLARGADVNACDSEQHSVVHWATVCGDAASLELVIGAGAAVSTPDLHGGYPIHYAAQLCGPQGACATAADNSNRVSSASRSITDRGAGLAVLRTLLAAGAPVSVRDHDGRQPLLWAASAGSADAILALINAGADIEAEDKDGLTALHCAASRGHTDCVETLVSLCGAHVDVIDSNGCTALFYAVTLGHADATRLLLRRGAEPNRQDRKGRTAAHCGAAKGQLETLRILSSHGANLWLRNVRGDFPLHDAVQSGRSDLVRWLLSSKQGGLGSSQTSTSVPLSTAADATNNDGRTPLHVAALHNNIEICKILLDARCLLNPTMRTNRHQLLTPLDAALLRGNRGCAKFLQLHGGVPASRLTESLGRLRATGRSPPLKQVGSCSSEPSPPDRISASMDYQSRTIQILMKDDVLQVGAPVVVCHHVTRSAPGSDGECSNMCRQHAHCCKRSLRRRTQTEIQRWRRRERQAKRREARLREISQASSCSEDEEDVRKNHRGSGQKSTLSDGDSPMRVCSGTSFVRVDDDYLHRSDGESIRQEHNKSDKMASDGGSARRNRKHDKQRSRTSRSSHRNKDNTYSDVSHNLPHEADELASKSSHRKVNDVETCEMSDRERDSKNARSECETEGTVSHRNDTQKNKLERRSESSRRSRTKLNDRELGKTPLSSKKPSQDSQRSSHLHIIKDDDGPKISTKAVTGTSQERSKTLERSTKTKHTHSSQKDVEIRSTTVLNVQKPAKEHTKSRKDLLNSQTNNREDNTKEWARDETVDSSPTHDQEISTQTVVRAVVHRENIPASSEDGTSENSQEKESPEIDENRTHEDHKTDAVHSLEQVVSANEEVSDTVSSGLDEQNRNSLNERTSQTRPEDQVKAIEAVESHVETRETKEFQKDQVTSKEETESSSEYRKDNEVDQGESGNTNVPEQNAHNHSQSESQSNQKAQEVKLVDTTKERLSSGIHAKQPAFERSKHRASVVGEKEKGFSKEALSQKSSKYSTSNIRKEKISQKQGKNMPTKSSYYTISSKKTGPKTTGKTSTNTAVAHTGEPAFAIDVDDESSRSHNDQLVDSGLEPSPRRETDKDSRLHDLESSEDKHASDREEQKRFQTNAKYEDDGTDYPGDGGGFEQPDDRRNKANEKEEVSVTRAVQISMRKYHLERRIFHELLELKRLQIRAGRANEQVLVKRLVDDYRRAGLCVDLQQYSGTYTFRSFEKYLYEQLRALQAAGQQVVPRLQSSDDLERLTAALRRTRARHGSPPDDPLLCTLSTHRCHHALHAYSGVPCAAYIPRMNHHTIPKEDLDDPGAHARAHARRSRSNVSFLPLIDDRQKEIGRFSRLVDSSRPVTLQLSHGQEKQVISLPTERLDKHKRYYVTFTIKGGPPTAPAENNSQEPPFKGTSPGETEAAVNGFNVQEDSHDNPPKMPRRGKSF